MIELLISAKYVVIALGIIAWFLITISSLQGGVLGLEDREWTRGIICLVVAFISFVMAVHLIRYLVRE